MFEKIREWGALLGLVFFLGAGLVYSVVVDPNAGAKKVRNSQLLACERGVAKAQIIENFFYKAASTRSFSAAQDREKGDLVGAANEQSASDEYKNYAHQYIVQTPTDCSAAYPAP